jgi:hypothetical protein
MGSRKTATSFAVAVVVLLAVVGGGSGATAAPGQTSSIAGTWAGTYSGAYSGTFTLHWRQTGSKLRGSIALSNPHGTYGVTGSVSGSTINFGAVTAGATYSGSLSRSGKSMSGHYRTRRGVGSWSARKTS